MQFPRCLFLWICLAGVFVLPAWGRAQESNSADSVLLQTMKQELGRAMTFLAKADPAPYFISYSASDEFQNVIMASNGAIVGNIDRHSRIADISVRVGSPDLDNTHGEHRFGSVVTAVLPLDDKPDAIARVLWLNTDHMYK